MKKLIMMSLMAMTILSLAACNNDSTNGDKETPREKQTINMTGFGELATDELVITGTTKLATVTFMVDATGNMVVAMDAEVLTGADPVTVKALSDAITADMATKLNAALPAAQKALGLIKVTAASSAYANGDDAGASATVTLTFTIAKSYTEDTLDPVAPTKGTLKITASADTVGLIVE